MAARTARLRGTTEPHSKWIPTPENSRRDPDSLGGPHFDRCDAVGAQQVDNQCCQGLTEVARESEWKRTGANEWAPG